MGCERAAPQKFHFNVIHGIVKMVTSLLGKSPVAGKQRGFHLLEVRRLLRLYHAVLIAWHQVDQLQLIFVLRLLHQFEVEVVLGVGLSLHVNGILAKEVLETAERLAHALLDLLIRDFAQ